MDYIRVKLYLENETMEPLSILLEEQGVYGIEIEDSTIIQDLLNKKNSYEWDYLSEDVMSIKDRPVSATFYLEDDPAGMDRLEQILEELEVLSIEKVEVASVSDHLWKDNWKKYFKPAKITDRIVVKPSWETYEKVEDDEIVIEIDPGMAFGTGTHSTTSLCIKLLERYIQKGEHIVLDVGTGSGILSIGAALLGAKDVLGIDIDPEAVAIAKRNVEANHLDSSIHIQQGDLASGLTYQANIIVANLMADLVIRLSKDAASHLLESGVYISSGILTEQRDLVSKAIEEAGFQILEIEEEGDWCAIAARVG